MPLLGALASFLRSSLGPLLGLSVASLALVGSGALGVRIAVDGPWRYPLGGWWAPLGIDLYVDGLAVAMVGLVAVVGGAVSLYGAGYFSATSDNAPGHEHQAVARAYFWPLWLFLWAALNALFLSADLFNVYVTLELLGLSAVALVALAGGREALNGAMRYLLVGLLGSLSYLLGVALLYAGYGVLDMALLAQRLEPSPVTWAAMALMTAGLLLKTALFPLHFWLPPAHASAPAPASALLSALVVKASFYLLLRLWFETFATVVTPALAQVLGILGGAAILWGSVQALRAVRLKLLVAYSTVAQIGYLFLVFPLAQGGAGLAAWTGTVGFALAHGIAKAAMFMAAGTIMKVAGHDRVADLVGIGQRLPLSLFALALAGISLIGLPPSGGFVAKWLLLNAAISQGQWWWVAVLLAGTLLAAGYVFRVLTPAFSRVPDGQTPGRVHVPGSLEWSAFILAVLAVLLGFLFDAPLRLLGEGAPFSGPMLVPVPP